MSYHVPDWGALGEDARGLLVMLAAARLRGEDTGSDFDRLPPALADDEEIARSWTASGAWTNWLAAGAEVRRTYMRRVLEDLRRAAPGGAHNQRTEEPTMATNDQKTIDELTEQVAEMVRELEGLGDAIEAALNHQLAASGKKLVKVEESDPSVELFAEPVAYYAEQVENESVTSLRRQLTDAEEELERADSWVQRTRAEERVRSLKQDIDFSLMDRPGAPASIVGVKKAGPTEYLPPKPPEADPDVLARDEERFRRRRS